MVGRLKMAKNDQAMPIPLLTHAISDNLLPEKMNIDANVIIPLPSMIVFELVECTSPLFSPTYSGVVNSM